MDVTWASYALGMGGQNAALLDAQGNVILGTDDDKQAYSELIRYIKMYPPCESEENLSYLLEKVDADACIRFMAMWIFLGNSDQSTLRTVRDADGRWQYVWTDSTWCMFNSAYDSAASCMSPEGMGPAKINNTVFLALLEIGEYREAFLTEMGKIYQYFTAEKMISFVDTLANEISGEMMLHCVRWRNGDFSNFEPRLEGKNANEAYQFWQSRIERLKNTCRRRPSFVWAQVQTAFGL